MLLLIIDQPLITHYYIFNNNRQIVVEIRQTSFEKKKEFTCELRPLMHNEMSFK